MSKGPDSNETVTVANDGITVEKTVTADEFPVPAVVFVIRCEGSTPAHVRLTDQIPEDFPMERVGFHPEYESDRWTAYKDHRVEFERELNAGEEIKTVYGIRTDDDSDLSSFLSEPSVKELSAKEQQEATDIEGVLGPDNSQLVRDVLSGDRSSLPGADGQVPDPLSTDAPDPLADATGGSLGTPSSNADDDASGVIDTDNSNTPEAESETTDAETESPTETVPVNEGELSVDDEPTGPASVDAAEAEADTDETVDAETDTDETVDAEDTDETVNTEDEADEMVDAEAEADTDADTDETTEAEADIDETVDDPDDPAITADSDNIQTTSDSPSAMESHETAADPQDLSNDLQPAITAEPAVDREVDDSSSVVAVQGGIAAVLASELRNDNVSEEDRALLEKELGSGVPRSVEVRLDRVQSQLEDLSAYTDALEAFINENGTAKDIFKDIRDDVNELSSEVDEISVELDSAAGERTDLSADIASVRTGLNDLERELEGFSDRVETTESDVETLDERVETAETTVDDATDQVEKLDANVSKLSRDVETATETADSAQADVEDALTTATSAESIAEESADAVEGLDTDLDHAFEQLSDLGESLDDLDIQVDDLADGLDDTDEAIVEINDELESLDDTIRSTKRRLRSEIDELREQLEAFDDIDTKADADDLDAVRDRLEELSAEIDAFQQFRNQLSSAFGGVGGTLEE